MGVMGKDAADPGGHLNCGFHVAVAIASVEQGHLWCEHPTPPPTSVTPRMTSSCLTNAICLWLESDFVLVSV